MTKRLTIIWGILALFMAVGSVRGAIEYRAANSDKEMNPCFLTCDSDIKE